MPPTGETSGRRIGQTAGKPANAGFAGVSWAGCGGLTAQSLPKLELPGAWERARRSLAGSFHRALRDAHAVSCNWATSRSLEPSVETPAPLPLR
jgi:hypothetical protein